tara:strand:- start:901 stop:1284 length:384 start_codon:yes stop_codon:yes gene_type:complete
MKIKTIGLLFILTTLISCGTSFGKKKEFGNLEIFYSESVSVEYVEQVGNYFNDNNLILDQKHSIKLTSNHNSFILKMILNTDYKELPPEMENDLTLLELDLKDKVFKDVNFEIEICDVNFYPLNLRN